MVLRLREHSDLSGLGELGFFSEDVAALERMFAKPAGLVLITGPTGSGKSSSARGAAHAVADRAQRADRRGSIEYRVPGACRTEVNRRSGYEFGSALRHFLRHDPDVILLGEMRDAETAQAAIEAAATGHLVLSTLHVSGVFGVVPRLRPLGLEAQVIADNLLAVVNQRLVRQNCPFCSEDVAFTAAERAPGSGSKTSMPAAVAAPAVIAAAAAATTAACRSTKFWSSTTPSPTRSPMTAAAKRFATWPTAAASPTWSALAKRRVMMGQTTATEVLRVVGDGPAAEPVGT